MLVGVYRRLTGKARSQKTEQKAGCSRARNGAWPAGGWKEWAWPEPKFKLLHLRDLSCAVGFTQSPALRDALGRSGLGCGFPSGRGLVGRLFCGSDPGSVEGVLLPTSQEYELLTYVAVWTARLWLPCMVAGDWGHGGLSLSRSLPTAP